MISNSDAFSFDIFFDFQLWRSHKSFFEYHLEYSEILTSHELGLLLIGTSALSVLILTFPSVSVVYSVVFLLFLNIFTVLNHSRQISYIILPKDVIC